MLQQTTVAAVIPYFDKFVSRFPTVAALAAAPLESVLAAWAGLGYYARARNLHACAQAVAAAGGFPRDLAGLRALAGHRRIHRRGRGGDRVRRAGGAGGRQCGAGGVAGCSRSTDPLPGAKPTLRRLAQQIGGDPAAAVRPSDFAQALFDLGATVCTPAAPACVLCPWMRGCAARQAGIADTLPRKTPKPERPLRRGVHFWLEDDAGHVLLRRRAPEGLLGGMTELPGTPWREAAWSQAEALAHAPMPADWRPAGEVRHGFTHFALTIDLLAARVPRIEADGLPAPRHGSGRGGAAVGDAQMRADEPAAVGSRPVRRHAPHASCGIGLSGHSP